MILLVVLLSVLAYIAVGMWLGGYLWELVGCGDEPIALMGGLFWPIALIFLALRPVAKMGRRLGERKRKADYAKEQDYRRAQEELEAAERELN